MIRPIFATCLFLTAMCACATAEVPAVEEEDAELKAATTLTEKDDGRTVSFAVGQKFGLHWRVIRQRATTGPIPRLN